MTDRLARWLFKIAIIVFAIAGAARMVSDLLNLKSRLEEVAVLIAVYNLLNPVLLVSGAAIIVIGLYIAIEGEWIAWAARQWNAAPINALTTPLPSALNMETSMAGVSQQRRELISCAREAVGRLLKESKEYHHFRSGILIEPAYLNLKPYLSQTFRDRMDARTIFIDIGSASDWPVLARDFVNEIDRLEREWGLL